MQTPINHNILVTAALTLCATISTLALRAQEAPIFGQNQVPGTNTQTVNVPAPAATFLLNNIRTYTPRTRIINEAEVTDASSPEQVSINITYKNGLGKTIQSIQQNATKAADGQYRHLVVPNDVRSLANPYSFMPYPSATKTFNQNAINQSINYHNSTRYPSEAGVSDNAVISTSQVLNSSTTAERSITTYAPGKSRMGQGRGTKTIAIVNKVIPRQTPTPGTNVRLWSLDAAGMPVSTSVYAAGMLQGSRTQNANGMEKILLNDRSGKPVYEASFQQRDGLLGIDPNGVPVYKRVYAETYYVYDELDRLRYILSPKAVAAISSAGWTASPNIIKELCFSYLYDARGRQHSVRKPGEQGYTEVVYNKEGEVIMRRSPLEREKGLWELLFYDRSKRVIATGLLTNAQDRGYWQAQANGETAPAANSAFYYIWGAGKGQHPPKTGLDATELVSFNYFDEYPATVLAAESYDPAPFQPHMTTSGTADVSTLRSSTYGFQTAGEAKVIHNAGINTQLQDWTMAKSFYDYYGRLIYSVGQNATGVKDSIYQQYNVTGQVLVSLHLRHAIHNSTDRRTVTVESSLYEPYSGRLSGVWRSTNGAVGEPAVRYTYNEMGQMTKEVLGNDAENRLYTYNVRGELSGINEDYALTGNKSGDMTFGEALRYDYGYVYPRYDGLVSGMIWRGSGGTGVRAHSYSYSYDSTGRMTGARYNESRTTGPVTLYWQVSRRNYSQTVSYDLNGNITAASRWGVSQNPALPGIVKVDSLSYDYMSNSNKLAKVTDAIVNDYQTGDYVPGATQGYTYDVSGNLTEDKSKNISSVTYTWFNKPETVHFTNGNRIYYTYDAGGNKLQEVTQAGSQNNVTNYISGGVYKNGILKYISTAQGRTNMESATPRQEYFVKDHLGNIRSIVASTMTRANEPVLERRAYTAGYEAEDEVVEEALFDKVAELREDKPGSLTADNQKAALLREEKCLGTSIMLKVMAGDKIDVNADNFYESLANSNNNNNNEAPAAVLFEQVIGSLAGRNSALNSVEGSGSNGFAQRILSNPEAVTAYEALLAAETDSTRPKAYLNFLFFDDGMNLVTEHSRLWQADGENSWRTIGSAEATPMEMPENGYIVAYLSNQSGQEAWFDNMNLVLSDGMLLEEHHYYAYGLPIAGLSSFAANASDHRQRYQGNEYIEELGLEWMDFHNRQYDPQLGRFLSVDPLADAGGQQVLSPYHAMGCNPVTMVDPLGLRAVSPAAKLLNFNIPNAGVAYIEGKRVVLGGTRTFNFDLDYAAYQAFVARTIEEQLGRYNYDNVQQGKILESYNYYVGLERERFREQSNALRNYFGGLFETQMKPGYQDGNGGHNLIIMFSGAAFSGGTSETLEEMATELRENRNSTVLTISSDYNNSDDGNTMYAVAYIQLFKKQNPDGKLLLYGYSYGGVLVNNLAKSLDRLSISVDYMAIVDGANGPKSSSVNRSITGNVKHTDNFYQTTPSSVGSYGAPYTGINRVNNYRMEYSHSAMDEITRNSVIMMMRAFSYPNSRR